MLITRSSTRASAVMHRNPEIVPAATRTNPWSACVALMSAALLSGCAGLPFAGGANDEAGQQARASLAVQAAASPERMRAMTARDILLEWGVSGRVRKLQRTRASGLAQASMAKSLPDYSASIQEIVANAVCRSCEQKPYHSMVLYASNLHGVPSGLIHAVIQKESGYNPGARSSKNARGLMQLTPDTGRFVGVANSASLYDPQTNINAGAAYLKYLMHTHGTVDQVLAAYNAGPGNVRKYKGVPPFTETRRYVSDVKKYYAVTSRELL